MESIKIAQKQHGHYTVCYGYFIHYGSNSFDANKFKVVKNKQVPDKKPEYGTGLWASPVSSNYGWKNWCEDEHFRGCDENNSFKFKFKKTAKIYVIDNLSDLQRLPMIKHKDSNYLHGLDFEKISKEYDAILLTEKGQWETRLSYPLNLYGWDCECILVLKSDSIIY